MIIYLSCPVYCMLASLELQVTSLIVIFNLPFFVLNRNTTCLQGFLLCWFCSQSPVARSCHTLWQTKSRKRKQSEIWCIERCDSRDCDCYVSGGHCRRLGHRTLYYEAPRKRFVRISKAWVGGFSSRDTECTKNHELIQLLNTYSISRSVCVIPMLVVGLGLFSLECH